MWGSRFIGRGRGTGSKLCSGTGKEAAVGEDKWDGWLVMYRVGCMG